MDDPVASWTDGMLARRRGEPLSACPFAPADPAGSGWRRGWIDAEASVREEAGTFGASDEDYQRAGLKPPRRSPRFVVADEVVYWVKIEVNAEAFSEALANALRVIEDSAAAIGEAQAKFSAAAAKPTAKHRPCPRHGPTESGLCRACARGRR